MEFEYNDICGDYTLKYQDQFWIVFTFDLWSDDQYLFERLYSRGIGNGWGYDLTISEVKVWTTRVEAEHFAQQLREYINLEMKWKDDHDEPPPVYVMNLGDEARWEARVTGGRDSGMPCRTTPKFKGSEDAWKALSEMSQKWRERNMTKS